MQDAMDRLEAASAMAARVKDVEAKLQDAMFELEAASAMDTRVKDLEEKMQEAVAKLEARATASGSASASSAPPAWLGQPSPGAPGLRSTVSWFEEKEASGWILCRLCNKYSGAAHIDSKDHKRKVTNCTADPRWAFQSYGVVVPAHQ